MEKQRVMLYFGSFNPIHNGHLALAEWVIEQNLADMIVFVPSPQNPFKTAEELAPEFHRYQMCSEAAYRSKYPGKIVVSAVEFTLNRPSYTINTLEWLEKNCGKQMTFSILMGADNIIDIKKWHRWEDVVKYPIFVYPRNGYTVEETELPSTVTFLKDAPLFDISATEIRKAYRSRKDISKMVHPAVLQYIRANNLW